MWLGRASTPRGFVNTGRWYVEQLVLQRGQPCVETMQVHVSFCYEATCHFHVCWRVILLCCNMSFGSPTCLLLGEPCVIFLYYSTWYLLIHVYYAYWSMCQLHSAAHVIFLLFHVSSFDCSTCRFPRVPRFFSLMVHLSYAYWSMCQFRVPMCHFAAVPRVVFLEFHMSISDQPTFAFIEDTCSFLDVTRAIHVIHTEPFHHITPNDTT